MNALRKAIETNHDENQYSEFITDLQIQIETLQRLLRQERINALKLQVAIDDSKKQMNTLRTNNKVLNAHVKALTKERAS